MSTAEVEYPITFSGGFLVCPGCGQNFLHHGAVTVYHRSIEDAETSPRWVALRASESPISHSTALA